MTRYALACNNPPPPKMKLFLSICAPQPLELRAAAWGHGIPKYVKCKETQSRKALESLGKTLNSEHGEL